VNPVQVGRAPAARRGAYFFLSYAHSAPAANEQTDTDHWVRVFYDDLAEAVQRFAHPATGLSIGFIDDVPPGSDRKAMLSDALGAAEVFVALYSPGYFNKSWPLRVRDSFRQRLREIEGVADRQRHLLPVLWVPLFSWEMTPEIQEALPLGTGVPAYAENGLRALCMLPSYREGAYRTIVDEIARRIVDVAENSPVGPSWAPPPEDLPGGDVERQFTVAVVAATTQDRPPGRGPWTYGPDPTQWRPFVDEDALPVAQYVANTAERLGVPAHVVAFNDDPTVVSGRAAVLLIDLWEAAGEGGPGRLRTLLARLPEWVMPLVVVDRRDPRFDGEGAALLQTIGDMLAGSGQLQIIEARDMRQFLDSVPLLVTEARRRYLKHGPKPDPVEAPPAPALPHQWKHGDD
jgi:FxsC-like protein